MTMDWTGLFLRPPGRIYMLSVDGLCLSHLYMACECGLLFDIYPISQSCCRKQAEGQPFMLLQSHPPFLQLRSCPMLVRASFGISPCLYVYNPA